MFTPLVPVWVGAHPNNFRPGRAGMKPAAIVIHCTDANDGHPGNAGTDAWFNNEKAIVSAHYSVDFEATRVGQHVKETDTAYHAGRVFGSTWKGLRPGINPNLYTIGIEHEAKGTDRWSEDQYVVSAMLSISIATWWKIPLDADHIVMHREIYSLKTCPGTFDKNKYLAIIQEILFSRTAKPPQAVPSTT